MKKRIPIEPNLRLLNVHPKEYGKGTYLYNFMLEEVMDYGPKTLAKFGATDKGAAVKLWNQLKFYIISRRNALRGEH
jgi:hypothetical protein